VRIVMSLGFMGQRNCYSTWHEGEGVVMHHPVKQVRPSYMDPEGSVDVFDMARRNEEGSHCCVAAGILPEEVDRYWKDYLESLRKRVRQ